MKRTYNKDRTFKAIIDGLTGVYFYCTSQKRVDRFASLVPVKTSRYRQFPVRKPPYRNNSYNLCIKEEMFL